MLLVPSHKWSEKENGHLAARRPVSAEGVNTPGLIVRSHRKKWVYGVRGRVPRPLLQRSGLPLVQESGEHLSKPRLRCLDGLLLTDPKDDRPSWCTVLLGIL